MNHMNIITISAIFKSKEEFGTEKENFLIYDYEDILEVKLSDIAEVDGHEFGDYKASVYIIAEDVSKALDIINESLSLLNYDFDDISISQTKA
jgi:hypothetical protein